MLYTNAYTLTKAEDTHPKLTKTDDRDYTPPRTDDHDASRGLVNGVLIGAMIWAVILGFLFL